MSGRKRSSWANTICAKCGELKTGTHECASLWLGWRESDGPGDEIQVRAWSGRSAAEKIAERYDLVSDDYVCVRRHPPHRVTMVFRFSIKVKRRHIASYVGPGGT